MRNITLLTFVLPLLVVSQSPEKILAKAINYHDPGNKWSELQATFHFVETRSKGPDRQTIFELNNGLEEWKLNRDNVEIYQVTGNQTQVIKGDKDEARGLLLRNYYLYLWGLPMKLKDGSTPEITLSENAKVGNNPTNVLRVEYEEDTWYFYFDEDSGKLLEYKFYKDEAAGKGELIKLEEEIQAKGIRIPQKRSWYTLPEMEYLGTDVLERVE
ncbi:MAG: DUF6503 family protein [Bacteroidota bacterium]